MPPPLGSVPTPLKERFAHAKAASFSLRTSSLGLASSINSINSPRSPRTESHQELNQEKLATTAQEEQLLNLYRKMSSRNNSQVVTMTKDQEKIMELHALFGPSGQNLNAAGREFIMEGNLIKICKRTPKQRRFYLFNDILVYGNPAGKGRLNSQSILPLGRLSVVSLPDDGDVKNAFTILSEKKSFIVMAESVEEKSKWLEKITFYVNQTLAKEPIKGQVSWAVMWTADYTVKECQVCRRVKFSTISRRHHCRRCGKVVCGTCSDYTAVLPSRPGIAVRVCWDCYEIGRRERQNGLVHVSGDHNASVSDSDSGSEGGLEDLGIQPGQANRWGSKYGRTWRVHGV